MVNIIKIDGNKYYIIIYEKKMEVIVQENAQLKRENAQLKRENAKLNAEDTTQIVAMWNARNDLRRAVNLLEIANSKIAKLEKFAI
tara:strand:+ start:413 stop:670 length:258 start_codon:yes stop_codon:yes gene_type:complete